LFPLSESAKRFRSAKVKVTQCDTYAALLTINLRRTGDKTECNTFCLNFRSATVRLAES